MNFKVVVPLLSLLASSHSFSRNRHFAPERTKANQTVIKDLKVRSDFQGRLKIYKIKGRVLLGNNPCLAAGVKVKVRAFERRNKVNIVALKKGETRFRRCTRELRPVYHNFKLKVKETKKAVVKNYQRMGHHVPLQSLEGSSSVRPFPPRFPRPIRPIPLPVRPRPVIPPVTPAPDTSFDNSLDLDDVYLGTPGVGGNGCPAGTTSTTLSPDKKVLSIIFDEYMAEAGEGTGKRVDRKSCNMAIPVHVPQGLSVSLFKIDYRGYVSTPIGGRAKLNVNYFFAGSNGPRVSRNFPGGFDDEYTFTDNLQAAAVTWSACGRDVNLRINSSMMARSNQDMEDALGTVDSIDVESGLKYHLKWKRCN
ncbi:DUF4360 domain-containing protein [Bacteriovoracales bacterium]|nr:DUF4360 domain-containing protein [Bacteriovoracales bacterium]